MRTVLVTGGVRRLGKAIADRLAAEGWRVIRSSSRSGAAEADIVCDLSKEGAAGELFAKACALSPSGRLDAIVNNASIYTGADDAAVLAAGFEAPKRLVELMRAQGGGAVVNILDAALLSGPGSRRAGAYAEAKRRLHALTLEAARECAADALRVNAVAPGPVLAPEGVHEKASPAPLGRPTPEAVAQAVAFLLDARFTTGAVIPVSGAPV